MSRLSFHAPDKTSHKMLKMVSEICVQIRGEGGNVGTFFRFLVGTLIKSNAHIICDSIVRTHYPVEQ